MKSILSSFVLSSVLAAASTAALAQNVTIVEPWVRGTVPAQKATGAFMQMSSAVPVRLVAASSPVAGVVEIHEMAMVDNVMKMRAVAGVDVVPGRTVELKPGGHHVMLMDLKGQMRAGDAVPITLTFEEAAGKRFTQQISATVKALGTGADKPMPKAHQH